MSFRPWNGFFNESVVCNQVKIIEHILIYNNRTHIDIRMIHRPELRHVVINQNELYRCLFVPETDWDGFGAFVDQNRKLRVIQMRYDYSDPHNPNVFGVGPCPYPDKHVHTFFYGTYRKLLKTEPEKVRWIWSQ